MPGSFSRSLGTIWQDEFIRRRARLAGWRRGDRGRGHPLGATRAYRNRPFLYEQTEMNEPDFWGDGRTMHRIFWYHRP